MLFLTYQDFTGRFELHTGMFDQPKLDDYINRYEPRYLIHLFGQKMYDEIQSDFDQTTQTFKSPNVVFITNEFYLDVNQFGGDVLISDGVKSMLLGFVYWEYMKDTINQMTPIGNVIPQNQNSTINSTIYSSMWSRYNEAIKTYRAIQRYLVLNRPLDIGQVISISGFTNGTGYLTQNTATAIQTAGSIGSGLVLGVNARGINGVNATTLLTGGTGYSTGTNRATTGGTGNGCVVNVVATAGVITSITIANNGGESYTLNDVLTIVQVGGAGATFRVDSLWNGQIMSLSILTGTNAGLNYKINDVVLILGGSNTATATINYVGVLDAKNWNGREKQTSYWL